LEVLFHFLNWAASFAEVDAESGSKMDSHNIATVMAPNILYPDPKVPGLVDESFISIEAVHMLLENNDQLCEVRRSHSMLFHYAQVRRFRRTSNPF
jgi:hypothetical protein